MGLNDFIQRLATNSYACKQWVPSDSCYCYSLEGQRHWVTQPEMPVICPLRTFCGLMWLPHQVIHIKVSTLCLFFYSPEVQSILNLSPPQEAELMNTNPSPPVSIFAFSLLYLHGTICRDVHAYPLFTMHFVVHIMAHPFLPRSPSHSPVHHNRSTSVHPPTPRPNPVTFTSSRWSARVASARCCSHAIAQMISFTQSKSYRKRPSSRRRR